MSRLAASGVALLFFASAFAGCAHRCASLAGGASTNVVAPQPAEVRTGRGNLSPDLSALSSYDAVDRVLSPLPAAGQYRALRVEEVQCLAAANAPLAKLYASESEAATTNTGRRGQQAAPVQAKLMAYRAVDQRNKAAGLALELFYRLAEAEANHDILDRSIEEIDRAVANLDQLRQSGLKVPVDQTAVRRQKLDGLDRRIQLSSAVRQMQGQLQQLCGFEADETMPVWPEADLIVTITPVDVQAAVAEGLASRADVGALGMLNVSLNADTLPAARSGMAPLGAGLGASIISKRLLGGKSGSAEELQARQAQLTQAQADTVRTASREIGEAAHDVETRLREIAVAKERQELWAHRVAELQERHETDGVTAFDLSAARLEWLHAQSDTVRRVIAWKIAQVKLKQAQGLLAAECGYRLPESCR